MSPHPQQGTFPIFGQETTPAPKKDKRVRGVFSETVNEITEDETLVGVYSKALEAGAAKAQAAEQVLDAWLQGEDVNLFERFQPDDENVSIFEAVNKIREEIVKRITRKLGKS